MDPHPEKDADVLWEAGYWEVADAEGEHGPHPRRLESATTDPLRCSLWMKLDLFFKDIDMEGYAYGQESYVEMSVQDGWAQAYDSWVIFLTLMAEQYSFPPPSSTSPGITPLLAGHLEQIESFPDEDREAFRQSLSAIQACSWRILRDWWEGSYQSCSISEAARRFVQARGQLDLKHLHHDASLYHENLFSLFDAEFNPSLYRTGTSRGNDGNRRLGFDHACVQKAAYMVYSSIYPAGCIKPDSLKTGRSFELAYDVCPWLPTGGKPAQDVDQLPYYIWDKAQKRTVEVKELLKDGLDVQYTCISHTWGRWENKEVPPVHVEGVDGWMVPENSLFEVRRLPEILNEIPTSNRFIWFDLICIPQDKTQKLYLIEVSRQAVIFQHASSCIAWMNTIHSWRNTEAAARWLCLHYLHHSSGEGYFNTDGLLSQATREANADIELALDSEHFIPTVWFSSLWTLQEACLCPDILLCDKYWQVLSVAPGSFITLNQLLTLFSLNSEAYFKPPINRRSWPRGPLQLLSIQELVFGVGNGVGRVGIIARGQTRECRERRAEAVMSVTGITDWYNNFVEAHGVPPPDTDLVLQTYPLAFVREAAQKMSSLFYMSFKNSIRTIPLEQVNGSMLPFAALGRADVVLDSGALEEDWYGDKVDHPSVSGWDIRSDASVKISEAGILGSSQRPQSRSINVVLNVAHEDGGNENFATDLQTWLMLVPSGTVRIAVSLCKIAYTHSGLLLEGKPMTNSNATVLRSIGLWDTTEEIGFPPAEKVEFIVR